MLHLIPAPIHRLLYRIAHAMRRRWWRLVPSSHHAVCVIGLNEGGELLLLRQSYGPTGWVLRGGGRRRGEDPARCALREFAEEARCGLRDLAFLGLSDEPFHRGRGAIHLFGGRVEGVPSPDGREIVEARFFPLHALPANVDPRVIDRLALAGF